MYSLEERYKFSDTLWDCLDSETDPEHVMQYIKAIELNYRHIELLRERARQEVTLGFLLKERRSAIQRERQKRERFFERSKMDKQCKAIQWILLGIIFGILAVVAFGCQTLGGACRDLESAARYGHEHLIVDK